MLNKLRYFIILSAFSFLVSYCGVQLIPERTKVAYRNEKYFHNFTTTVRRYGRHSKYYFNIEATTKHAWNNNVTFSLIFNEFLHNEYRRSFVELHYKYCDLLKDDKFLSPLIVKYGVTCPLPIGTYRFANLSVPLDEFPNVFPFERARVDIIYKRTETNEVMANVYLYALFKNIAKV